MGCNCGGGSAPATGQTAQAKRRAAAATGEPAVSTIGKFKVVKPNGIALLYTSEEQATRDAARWGATVERYVPGGG